MNKIPWDNPQVPKGYLSEEHKRKFTITAGILGAIFFIGQFILPFMLMLAIMPGMMLSEDFWMKEAKPQRGTFWNKCIWYVEKSISPKTSDPGRTILKTLDIGNERSPQSVGALSIDNPWLLAGNDRLWILSSSTIGFYQSGNLSVISEEKILGDISRPFLYEGHPAVVEERPNGFALMVFVDGAWQKKLSFPLSLEEKPGRIQDNLQVVPDERTLYLFLKFGETLYYREGLPASETDDQDAWQPVSEVKSDWVAFLIDGEPTVFLCRSKHDSSKVVGLRLKDKAWKSFFSYDTGMTSEVGVYPLGQSRRFAMLFQSFPGSLRLVQVDGVNVVKEIRYGNGFPFPRAFWTMMVGYYGMTLLLPLILAIILSNLMRKHRISEHESGSIKMPFGSLTRRALSQIIDFFVLGAPVIAGVLFLFPTFDMEKMFSPGRMLTGFGLMLSGLFWGLVCFFAFSFLEGRWGATPGKWAVGIRVLGTNLRPCGFGRALVRNLLKFIDGFFNFIIGILLAALSENCQRLGDMAANTVVIDVRKKLTLDLE